MDCSELMFLVAVGIFSKGSGSISIAPSGAALIRKRRSLSLNGGSLRLRQRKGA